MEAPAIGLCKWVTKSSTLGRGLFGTVWGRVQSFSKPQEARKAFDDLGLERNIIAQVEV